VALSLNNSSTYFNFALPAIGYPFSLVGWFRVPDTSALISFLGIASLSTGARCDIYYAGNGGKEAVAKSANGTSGSAYSTSPMTPGQWHHLTAVFSSATERKIYLDGSSEGVNNSNVPIGTLDFLYFGAAYSTTLVDVADVSLVAATVSKEQAVALANGYSLLASPISPNVIVYHDCIRRGNRPGIGPVFVSNGSPVVIDHPRMMFPNSGFSTALPDRVRGPFRIEKSLFRSQSAEQGQLSIAGVNSTNTILSGEVVG